jgi:hypothetical protein
MKYSSDKNAREMTKLNRVENEYAAVSAREVTKKNVASAK